MTVTTTLSARLKPHLAPLLPGLAAVGLFLVWAVHDGGFDEDTWYWGALAMLALWIGVAVALGPGSLRPSRTALAALSLFGLYVAWSYLSILWAQDQGAALTGSNRALLYLLTFGLLATLPWTPEAAMTALLTFAIGLGVIAVVLLVRLAGGANVGALVVGGRLEAPTGYFNSTAALFTIGALTAIALAARRELVGPIRGLLLAFAAAELDLAIVAQSRGWLFTLPLVALVAIVIVPDRLRVTAATVVAVAAAVIPVRRLLHIYESGASEPLRALAMHAGRPALALCFAAFVVGTLLAWADRLAGRPLRTWIRRTLGTALVVIAVAGVLASGLVVSKGHPVGFITRQWHGFAHEQTTASTGSHFGVVGSGRYDFWRTSLAAFEAHPIGGLGQDNFADYYVRHRRTVEEPEWTHSLEMRLLAHTGIVGFVLFFAFLALGLTAAVRARRRGPSLQRGAAAVALLPLTVWLIHGSVDWFWEFPALSGPALGFLAVAAALSRAPEREPRLARRRSRLGGVPRIAGALTVGAAALAATVVLAFPYLSVREVSIASNIQTTNPAAALQDLRRAGQLNPLDSNPGRVAGAIALRNGEWEAARRSFAQSIQREPGGWFSWLGAGLAASAQGHARAAHHDYAVAHSINRDQPAVQQALERVYRHHPLTSAQAFNLLVLFQ